MSAAPLQPLCSAGGGGSAAIAALRALLTATQGPQVSPSCETSGIPPTRNRRHPPRWSFPRQACCPPQAPSPGCPPCHRTFQSQRRASAKGQRPICDRYLDHGRPQGYRLEGSGQG
jgi:hypothetical protein